MLGRNADSPSGQRFAVFDRMGWTVALALAAVLGSAVTYGVARSRPMQSVSLKDSCGADVLFLGARGSGEKADDASLGFGATLFAAEHAMSTAFRPRNVVAEPVEYGAVSVPDVLRSGMATYTSSLSAGFESLQAKLTYWADKCPNYRFVLAGYSQGADVVGDVLADLSSSTSARATTILPRVVGVALFGDPRYNPADPVDVNRPTPDRKGVFATLPSDPRGLRPVFPANLQSRIGSWCLAGDVVCNTAPGPGVLGQLLGCIPSGACAHFHYADWGVAAGAGRWLAQQAGAAPSVSTSAPVPPAAAPPATPPTLKADPATAGPPAPVPPPAQPARPPQEAQPAPPQTQPQPPAPGPGQVPPSADPGQSVLPPGARQLGGLDLEAYCSGGWGLHAMLRYQVTWGWRCSTSTVPATGNRVGDQNVSVDDACAQQYHNDAAKSHYRDYHDANSWFCWIPG